MVDYHRLYSFHSNYLEIDDVRMHFLDEGDPKAPVVIMVHGNPTWSFYWRNLIALLKTKYRVIVPDHIGCGYSDKPQKYPYSLERHIRNLECLIESLHIHEKISLVMHDWGGAIACGYATRHPEKVDRLVVFNTSAFFEPVLYFPIKISRLPIIGDILVRGLNAFALGALVMGTSQPKKFNRDVRQGYLAPYKNWHNRVGILQFVRDIPMSVSHPTRRTIDEIDGRLSLLADKPMLILWGEKDPVFTVKTFLPGWQKRFPNAMVHVIDHAGHYVVEDAIEKIAPFVRSFMEISD